MLRRRWRRQPAIQPTSQSAVGLKASVRVTGRTLFFVRTWVYASRMRPVTGLCLVAGLAIFATQACEDDNLYHTNPTLNVPYPDGGAGVGVSADAAAGSDASATAGMGAAGAGTAGMGAAGAGTAGTGTAGKGGAGGSGGKGGAGGVSGTAGAGGAGSAGAGTGGARHRGRCGCGYRGRRRRRNRRQQPRGRGRRRRGRRRRARLKSALLRRRFGPRRSRKLVEHRDSVVNCRPFAV